ncbi:hypothetical protein D3C71_1405450 [compost metagenome]
MDGWRGKLVLLGVGRLSAAARSQYNPGHNCIKASAPFEFCRTQHTRGFHSRQVRTLEPDLQPGGCLLEGLVAGRPADGGRGGNATCSGRHYEALAGRRLFRGQTLLCLGLAVGGGGPDPAARHLQLLQRLLAGLGGQQRAAGHAPRHVRAPAGLAR